MKVLLVNKYHYFRGGSETYYFGLSELLKAKGHEVIYFAMQDEKNIPCEQSKYFVKNVDFNGKQSIFRKIKSAFKMIYSFEAKRKFKKLLKEEKPDIIHLNLFHRVLTASIVDVAKKLKIPVVFIMHDLNCVCPNHTMLDHGKICEACLKGKYSNCFKKVCFKDSKLKCMFASLESWYNKKSKLYNKIDLFITPSEFYKLKLEESGLTKNPIVHMKNFLPTETEYSVGVRGDYVLYYGRLSYEKGILTLVKAMQHVNSKLIIVGTGDMEEQIKATVHELLLEDKVELVGFKKGQELKDYVSNAGCVVIPSEWYEASGYTACEAQAMGKVAVVTMAGGLPENIVDGKTGFTVPMFSEDKLAEGINKVLSLSDAEYFSMAEQASLNAKALFDAEAYVDTLINYYQTLIKGEN